MGAALGYLNNEVATEVIAEIVRRCGAPGKGDGDRLLEIFQEHKLVTGNSL